jgi:type II secretory pathway predicted ATPase ExeA
VGQPELKAKLDESRNWEAREVIRRIEVLELDPLGGGADVAAYLDIKFGRPSKERKAVVSDEGCGALAEKLRRQTRNGVVYSIAYPLLINNWTRRTMNAAAEFDADMAALIGKSGSNKTRYGAMQLNTHRTCHF